MRALSLGLLLAAGLALADGQCDCSWTATYGCPLDAAAIDVNHDGHLDQNEAMDLNHDGSVSAKELAALDINHDGLTTKKEALEARRPSIGTKGYAKDDGSACFDHCCRTPSPPPPPPSPSPLPPPLPPLPPPPPPPLPPPSPLPQAPAAVKVVARPCDCSWTSTYACPLDEGSDGTAKASTKGFAKDDGT
eukprot:scaffold303160_cov18-Tisochrysis_lutea.AAC.1